MWRRGGSFRWLSASRGDSELLGEFYVRTDVDRRCVCRGLRIIGVAFPRPILSGAAKVDSMALITVIADSTGGSIV